MTEELMHVMAAPLTAGAESGKTTTQMENDHCQLACLLVIPRPQQEYSLIRHPDQAGVPDLVALKVNHCPDALTFMHQLKRFVDVFQRHVVGNKYV